jgi:hypothetical protein
LSSSSSSESLSRYDVEEVDPMVITRLILAVLEGKHFLSENKNLFF